MPAEYLAELMLLIFNLESIEYMYNMPIKQTNKKSWLGYYVILGFCEILLFKDKSYSFFSLRHHRVNSRLLQGVMSVRDVSVEAPSLGLPWP